jgi:hypothetical protein
MTIKERHELQQDIAIYHVLQERNRLNGPNLRRLMAYWMRQARKLNDTRLEGVAASL